MNDSSRKRTDEKKNSDESSDRLAGEMLFRAEVRMRAYEIFCKRCGAPGSEFEDWLTAEREVKARHGRP
jgi:hypothetical protein